jgi:amino acid transporter
MIGTSRLGYALAADGLFPKLFARVHPKFKTPYLSIVIQGATALLASVIGNLSLLIAVSVFFMAIAYLATSGAVFAFHKKGIGSQLHTRNLVIPGLGILFSVYLISQCTPVQLAIGVLLLLVGVPIYVKYSPKKELTELKNQLLSRENILKRMYAQERVFLAHMLLHVKQAYRKATRKKHI